MRKKPSFENIQHTEVVKESKSLSIISTEGGFLTFYLDLAFPRICGRLIPLSFGFAILFAVAFSAFLAFLTSESEELNDQICHYFINLWSMVNAIYELTSDTICLTRK